jgi:abhydrolase domain-containing protein 6
MKKRIIYIFIFFAIIAYGSYVFLPYYLTKQHTLSAYKKLNLEVKKIYYGKDYFEYIEGGQGETIVMVHGFQSSKNFWVSYIKKLSKNYNIIALDLQGHGNSSRPLNQEYGLQSVAEGLTKFIELKKIDNFHLIGSSMGGGAAAIYAYKNPNKVKSLTLINPLGIDQEHDSELQALVKKGKYIFFPNNVKEFDEMYFYITGKNLSLNSYFKKHIVAQMIKNYSFFKKAFNDLLTKTIPIDDILPKISTKTLLLLSQKDRIIHPNSYEYFVKLMPNAKTIRFLNGAHVFVDNDFAVAIKEIDSFLKNN